MSASATSGRALVIGLLWWPVAGCSAPDAVRNPAVLRRPTSDDLTAAYPPFAQMAGIEGRARVTCTIDREGPADDCHVVSESPEGLGFGQAALQVAKTMRFRPATVGGRPDIGAQISIPVHFVAPPPDAPPPRPVPHETAVDPAFLRLAHTLTFPLLEHEVVRQHGVETDPLAAAERNSVVHLVYARHRDRIEAAVAHVYAERLSAADAGDLATYLESRDGRQILDSLSKLRDGEALSGEETSRLRDFRLSPLGPALGAIRRPMTADMGPGLDLGAEIRREYCAAHDCAMRRPEQP